MRPVYSLSTVNIPIPKRDILTYLKTYHDQPKPDIVTHALVDTDSINQQRPFNVEPITLRLEPSEQTLTVTLEIDYRWVNPRYVISDVTAPHPTVADESPFKQPHEPPLSLQEISESNRTTGEEWRDRAAELSLNAVELLWYDANVVHGPFDSLNQVRDVMLKSVPNTVALLDPELDSFETEFHDILTWQVEGEYEHFQLKHLKFQPTTFKLAYEFTLPAQQISPPVEFA